MTMTSNDSNNSKNGHAFTPAIRPSHQNYSTQSRRRARDWRAVRSRACQGCLLHSKHACSAAGA
eukprot:8593252-Lingulodinium_polyedra.AAC.1